MGIFYGVGYIPCQYAIDNYDLVLYGVEFLFSHFIGGFLMSTIIMMVYSIVRKNEPSLPPQSVVPSFIGGFFWGTGQAFFILANYFIAFLVSFPILGFLCGVVACLWGFLRYKEIVGRENRVIFIIGYIIFAAGCVCIVLSDYQK